MFVKDGNVWLARPDGSAQYQVTSDGGYASPSQADDGTVVAAKDNRYLVRMTQNGTRLNAPLDTISPLNNVQEPRVSPDGSKIAYSFATVTNCGFGCLNARNATAYSYADHFGQPPGTGLQSGVESPSWNGNGRTLLDGDSNLVWYDNVSGGDNSYTQWFFDCDAFSPDCPQSLFQPVITRQGDKVAMVRRPPPHDRPDPTDTLVLFTQAGDVSTTKPVPVCEFTGPIGGYHDPTWAPSGQAVAWQEGDGIHVARVTSLDSTCAGISGGDVPVIPGASDPNWGPADVNPAPRPAPGPTPGPIPSPGPTGGSTGGSTGGPTGGPSAKCLVPKLAGLKLAAAKAKLKKAGCATGKVTPTKVKSSWVVKKQSVKAGASVVAGARVDVALGKAAKKKKGKKS